MTTDLGGRPPYQPTDQARETVEFMTAAGIVQPDIARCLGICQETLTKYYREELDNAVSRANAKVANSLFRKALSDEHPQAATCAIFWLKTRAHWKETQVNELTGKDGLPLFNMYAPGMKD